jgi:hypothetical protein
MSIDIATAYGRQLCYILLVLRVQINNRCKPQDSWSQILCPADANVKAVDVAGVEVRNGILNNPQLRCPSGGPQILPIGTDPVTGSCNRFNDAGPVVHPTTRTNEAEKREQKKPTPHGFNLCHEFKIFQHPPRLSSIPFDQLKRYHNLSVEPHNSLHTCFHSELHLSIETTMI